MPIASESGTNSKLLTEIKWVSRLSRQPNWAIEKVTSPYTIIWFILQGRKTIRLNETEYKLQPGDLVVIRPQVSITVLADGAGQAAMEHFAIGLSLKLGLFDLVSLYKLTIVNAITNQSSRERLSAVWTDLADAFNRLDRYESPPMLPLIHMNGQSFQLLHIILTMLLDPLEKPALPIDLRVSEACSYIRDHVSEKLHMSEIARRVYLSESHMRLLFKQTLGISPIEYVRQVRMEKTRELLSSSHCSVGEISERVGYDDQSQLSRAFRQLEGITPLEYRRRWQLL